VPAGTTQQAPSSDKAARIVKADGYLATNLIGENGLGDTT